VEVVASLSQGRTAAAQCGLFTHKSVLVIFEPPLCPTPDGQVFVYPSLLGPSLGPLNSLAQSVPAKTSRGQSG